jgi:surface protein
VTLTKLFTQIANAIREKKGTVGTIIASNFPNEILEIGGGDNTPIEVTQSYTSSSSPNGGNVTQFIKKINPVKMTKGGCNFLFNYFKELEDIEIEFTTKVTSTRHMFNYCQKLKKITTINFDTSIATDMERTFGDCRALTEIPQMDTSNATNMNYMFLNCYELESIPQLNTSNVIYMDSMFSNCKKITTIPLLDTSKATNMGYMFYNCENLLTVPQLNTSSATKMGSMFYNCKNLTTIPQLDTSKVTNMNYMFQTCKSLTDESLNNILAMCINATSYTGTKTLRILGIESINYPASRIQALSNYQAFIDAGWTIGY